MKLAVIEGKSGSRNMVYKYRLAYHMWLAQKVREDYDRFGRILRNYKRWGYFLMLDNGTAEGQPLSHDELMEVWDFVRPDELVLPDVLEDRSGTLAATQLFLEGYGDKVPVQKRVVVPQGETLDEWEDCLDAMASRFEFATIGVPKHLEGKDGNRVEAVRFIEERGYHRKYHVHLLGCYEDPVLEIRRALAMGPWIRGIDTAAPIAYAQQGLDIQVGYHVGYVWNGGFVGREEEIEQLLSMNMDKLLKACAGG